MRITSYMHHISDRKIPASVLTCSTGVSTSFPIPRRHSAGSCELVQAFTQDMIPSGIRTRQTVSMVLIQWLWVGRSKSGLLPCIVTSYPKCMDCLATTCELWVVPPHMCEQYPGTLKSYTPGYRMVSANHTNHSINVLSAYNSSDYITTQFLCNILYIAYRNCSRIVHIRIWSKLWSLRLSLSLSLANLNITFWIQHRI